MKLTALFIVLSIFLVSAFNKKEDPSLLELDNTSEDYEEHYYGDAMDQADRELRGYYYGGDDNGDDNDYYEYRDSNRGYRSYGNSGYRNSYNNYKVRPVYRRYYYGSGKGMGKGMS